MIRRVDRGPSFDPVVTERIGELLRAMVCAGWPPGSRSWQYSNRSTALSVAEIDQRLRECLPPEDQPPDLATIYRTVTTLVDQGVLHALTLEGGVTTYGLAADPHHHAVCTRCGSIIEVPAGRLAARWNTRWWAVRSRCPSTPDSPCTDYARSVRGAPREARRAAQPLVCHMQLAVWCSASPGSPLGLQRTA